jgi:hypothetical protein
MGRKRDGLAMFNLEWPSDIEVEVEIPEAALVEIGNVILQEIRRNAKAGIGADGKIYKDAKGKKIDWKETGDLMTNVQVDAHLPGLQDSKEAQEVAVLFLVDYASFVNAKYPFAGIGSTEALGFQMSVMPKIQKILDKQAVIKVVQK